MLLLIYILNQAKERKEIFISAVEIYLIFETIIIYCLNYLQENKRKRTAFSINKGEFVTSVALSSKSQAYGTTGF